MMHLVVLLAFLLILAMPPLVEAPLSPIRLGLLVALSWGGMAALGAADLALTRRQLDRAGWSRAVRAHRHRTMLIKAWLLGTVGVLMAMGLRPAVTGALHTDRLPLLSDLLLMIPFVGALLIGWMAEYPVHRLIRRQLASSGSARKSGWTLGEFLIFHLRHQLLFVAVPICLIVLVLDSMLLYVAPALPETDWADSMLVGISLFAAGAVFLIAPWLVVRIWKTRPLPDGPVRSDLEQMCATFGVGYRELLLWDSGGVVVNAAAMGLAGPFRYLLLSDALLEALPLEQVRAVFAHELAHARCRHLPFAALFALSAALLSSAGAWGISLVLGGGETLEALITLLLLGGAWAGGFGFVSQHFERQSDVIGAWASDPYHHPAADDPQVTPVGAQVFATALEQIGRLNGMSLDQYNWLHGRLSDRIAYVSRVGHSGAGRRPIDRRVGLIKAVLWGALGAGMGLLFLRLWVEA
jgi:Zn-dependent protease with chaperone function